jgi:hypothetical protein
LILAGGHSVFSQDAPAVKRTDLATIEGRAVNSVTAAPFTSERVTLRALPPGTDAWGIQPDFEGRFTFDEMEPGSYILCVRRFGNDGMPVKLSAGQVLKDVEFRITLPGAIRGIVVDDEGRPLPNLLVNASGGVVGPSDLARTNNAGEFRFPLLPPGSYTLLATPDDRLMKPTAPGSAEGPAKAEERLLPTYYPAAADVAGAVPLEVAPGQELLGITIVVRKGRLYHVQGTVTPLSPDGSLAAVGLSMTPRTSGLGIPATAELKPDGSFDFSDVRPGSHDLIAWRRTPAPTVTLGRVQVDVTDADVTGVVLRIEEPRPVQGRMRMEGQDKPDFTGVRVELRRLESILSLSSAALNAENTFTLKEVPPDKLLVVVKGLPGKAYVKSIRLGGWETIDSGLDLTDMQIVPLLDILISPNGATIEVTVNQDDGKPSAGAWVCLVPDLAQPELTSRIEYATTSGDGRFTFAGVPPGEYRLYAFEPLKRELYGSQVLEFLKPFESKATRLSLKEGERKQADVKALKLEWPGAL